jgi:hypothetical protein
MPCRPRWRRSLGFALCWAVALAGAWLPGYWCCCVGIKMVYDSEGCILSICLHSRCPPDSTLQKPFLRTLLQQMHASSAVKLPMTPCVSYIVSARAVDQQRGSTELQSLLTFVSETHKQLLCLERQCPTASGWWNRTADPCSCRRLRDVEHLCFTEVEASIAHSALGLDFNACWIYGDRGTR